MGMNYLEKECVVCLLRALQPAPKYLKFEELEIKQLLTPLDYNSTRLYDW